MDPSIQNHVLPRPDQNRLLELHLRVAETRSCEETSLIFVLTQDMKLSAEGGLGSA